MMFVKNQKAKSGNMQLNHTRWNMSINYVGVSEAYRQ